MDIGVIQSLGNGGDCFAPVREFGLRCCQLVSWNPDLATPEIAATVRRCAQRDGVRVAAVWGGFPGPAQWNFTEGPTTLGLCRGSSAPSASPLSSAGPASPPRSAPRR